MEMERLGVWRDKVIGVKGVYGATRRLVKAMRQLHETYLQGVLQWGHEL